jgi:hypothetical protein
MIITFRVIVIFIISWTEVLGDLPRAVSTNSAVKPFTAETAENRR